MAKYKRILKVKTVPNGYNLSTMQLVTNQHSGLSSAISIAPEVINTADKEGRTALHRAAELGNTTLVMKLLTTMSQEAIFTVDKHGNTALRPAVIMGHEPIVQILLEACPTMIDIVDKRNKSVLHWVKDGKIAELLLNRMSKEVINSTAKDGINVLQQASKMGYWQVVNLLLDKMSPEGINVITKHGSALHLAANEKVVELLLSRMSPETINAIDVQGNTALHLTANEKVTELLLTRMNQAAIDLVNVNGNTALCLAIINGNEPKCKLLLSKTSQEVIDIVTNGNGSALSQVIKLISQDDAKPVFSKSTDKNGYEMVIKLIHSKMLFGDIINSLEQGEVSSKAIKLVVEHCKPLLLYLPKGITKIVYDYIIQSCDVSGNLIDETSSNYSSYKFKTILEIALKGYRSFLPINIYEDKEVLLQNIYSIEVAQFV